MKSINHLRKALELLKQAQTELKLAVNCRDSFECDAEYYHHEVSELISCDNGDAGLEVLVDRFKYL